MTLQQTFDFGAAKSAQRRNIVIEAGAGTGKTTAIVAEVLKIMLENEELSPERIVLVTFTEKAAGEIADRIHAALAELEMRFDDERVAWPADSPNPLFVVPPERKDAYRRACAKQLARIGSLRSQTIHSFCQSLLRQFPIEAGLDPQFKIIEGFERSLLHGQLYDGWIDEETRTNAGADVLREWEVLLAHAGYLFQVRAMIFSMVERRDLLAESGYDMGDMSLIAAELRQAIDIVRSDSTSAIGRYVRATRPPALDASIDDWIDYFAPIADEIRNVNLTRVKGELKEAMKVLRSGDTGRSIHQRLTGHRAAMALHALTRRFVDYLDREKRRLGFVDFDDLLLRTLAVLDDPNVLERARRQYDYIFVDEFQDTDRTQAKIIERLARNAAGEYVEGKTIVVGDPKQSIYGFRRADPETYDAMTARLTRAGAEKRIIVDQYRSDPELLDAINVMFTQLFAGGSSDPNVFWPAYHPLRAAKTAAPRVLDAPLTLIDADHDERGDRFVAEAEAMARWIHAHGEGDFRRYAILFRRMTQIDDYLDVFDREGVPYVLPPTRMFLDRRAPVDLLAVLRAIAFPFDRGAMISAARTPYFGLTDEEIVLGAGVIPSVSEGPGRAGGARNDDSSAAPPPRPLADARGDNSAWDSFVAAIRGYSAGTVSELIDLVIANTKIEAVYDAAADGERSKRHLDHVRAIAFDYDRTTGGSVRQFVDEIERRRGEPDEMEPSLIDDNENAVRILTVHAAKGLEFDTVIIPDLSFSAGGSESTQIFTVEDPKSLVMCTPDSLSGRFRFSGGEKLKDIGGLREEAEARRLFYVAVTRAMTDVAFVCGDMTRVKDASFAACLRDALGLDVKTLTWRDGLELRDVNGIVVAFEKLTGPAGKLRRRKLLDPDLEQRLASGDIVPLSIAPPPVAEPLPAATIAMSRAGSRNRIAGTLLHRVLERWDGAAPLDPLVNALAGELGANAQTVARVRQRLGTVSHSKTMRRIAAAETIGRELPVRFAEEERRIDRLIRENGREIVVDYKGGTPKAEDHAQVRRYCEAVTAITGRECGGLLWYIDLDSDEAVEVAR
jgi:ATP-dependent helicase/nuclease subunit A